MSLGRSWYSACMIRVHEHKTTYVCVNIRVHTDEHTFSYICMNLKLSKIYLSVNFAHSKTCSPWVVMGSGSLCLVTSAIRPAAVQRKEGGPCTLGRKRRAWGVGGG